MTLLSFVPKNMKLLTLKIKRKNVACYTAAVHHDNTAAYERVGGQYQYPAAFDPKGACTGG